MKLNQALEMGYLCGLKTAEEAIRNIHYHAESLFQYSEIRPELDELEKETVNTNLDGMINDMLGKEECARIDRAYEESMVFIPNE